MDKETYKSIKKRIRSLNFENVPGINCILLWSRSNGRCYRVFTLARDRKENKMKIIRRNRVRFISSPRAIAVGLANENINAADEISETTKRMSGKSVLHSRSYIGDAREAPIKTDHIEIRNETSVVKYLVVRVSCVDKTTFNETPATRDRDKPIKLTWV